MAKEQITFGVHFYLKTAKENKKAKNKGLSPVYARITVNGETTELTAKCKCKEENWSNKKAFAQGNTNEIAAINRLLIKLGADLTKVYEDLKREDIFITCHLVKSVYSGGGIERPTLLKLIDRHYKSQETKLKEGTLKNYRVTNQHLKDFVGEEYKTPDVFLKQIGVSFIARFEDWLRQRKDEEGEAAMMNNSVMKQLERFRCILKTALKLEWISQNPFQAYELSYDKARPRHLKPEELDQLEETPINDKQIDLVRDLFAFSCYTGLAWTDAKLLDPGDLVLGIDGQYWLVDSRQKTETPFRVPLFPKAKEILDKYRNHPKCLANGRLLPMYSNQKMNEYLKIVALICCIETELTFHVARHTFATVICLANGIPIETTGKMMGLAKVSSVQVYGHVIDQKIAAETASLTEKLRIKKLEQLKASGETLVYELTG